MGSPVFNVSGSRLIPWMIGGARTAKIIVFVKVWMICGHG